MELNHIIILIAIAIVVLVLFNLVNKTTPKGIDKLYFKQEWNDIVQLSEDPKTRPLSVIQADKLLDEALKCCGYSGKTMAERLIAAKKRLKNRNHVWSAHKLRNKVVHEPLAEPTEKEVRLALKGYRQAFNDLGVF